MRGGLCFARFQEYARQGGGTPGRQGLETGDRPQRDCKCDIQKWPGRSTSRQNRHRIAILNKRRTYCSLETGAPENDALSSTATTS